MAATALPEELPIFPLPDVVLFPTVRLPLHMFEPRYRRLAADVLAGDRVFGMALLKPPVHSDTGDSPVYDVGCAGTVTRARELPDGRYHLLLEGRVRFRITGEVPTDRPYRIARIEALVERSAEALSQNEREALAELRTRLEQVLTELLGPRARGPDDVHGRLGSLDDDALVNALAFGLDLPAVERQSLLECDDTYARGVLLERLLRMQQAESQLPQSDRIVN